MEIKNIGIDNTKRISEKIFTSNPTFAPFYKDGIWHSYSHIPMWVGFNKPKKEEPTWKKIARQTEEQFRHDFEEQR
jgi:hypothetical protein